jgi:hypothetical protein
MAISPDQSWSMICAREPIQYEPCISEKAMVLRLEIYHETVKRILKHELSIVKTNLTVIRYLLTDLQKQQWVDGTIELLQFISVFSTQNSIEFSRGTKSGFLGEQTKFNTGSTSNSEADTIQQE